MAKLSKIQRLMRDRPEMFDYADCPPRYKLTPAQEARNAAARPKWFNVSDEDTDIAASDGDDSQLDFPGFREVSDLGPTFGMMPNPAP